MDIELLIKCQNNQRNAQRQLYEQMSPKLFYLCKRYLKHDIEIEETLADSFYIIFTKMKQLKELKAFEGWARKITVNQCLQTIRKKVNFNIYIDDLKTTPNEMSFEENHLEEDELFSLLDQIPDGCRTIFNLYAIEGFSHKEIAEQLGVTTGTTKSQLNVARTKLQALVNQYYYQKTKSL